MTTYAHHPSASSIVATWPTGAGSVATRATRIPGSCDGALARHLARSLDRLSERIWIVYCVPDAELPDPVRLVGILRSPHRPVGHLLRIAEDALDECAHAVGRVLAEIDDRGCREAVVREVEAECAALRSAIRGDLGGRAQQAVTRVRPVWSDDELATAQALLHATPLGSEKLFTDVGPMVACVAALEWFGATVLLTARRGGYASSPELVHHAQLVADKDLRVALALFERPMIDAVELVRELLREALLAGTGLFVLDPEQMIDVEPPDGNLDDGYRAVSTVLDPVEPGRALLEGIITGIQACFEVYLEDVADAEVPDPDPRLTGPHWAEEIRQRFDAEVREVVATTREALRR